MYTVHWLPKNRLYHTDNFAYPDFDNRTALGKSALTDIHRAAHCTRHCLPNVRLDRLNLLHKFAFGSHDLDNRNRALLWVPPYLHHRRPNLPRYYHFDSDATVSHNRRGRD